MTENERLRNPKLMINTCQWQKLKSLYLERHRIDLGPNRTTKVQSYISEVPLSWLASNCVTTNFFFPSAGPSPAKKRRSHNESTGKLELTIPKTPSLETRSRKRDHHIISQAELDEMELEEIKKWVFLPPASEGWREVIFSLCVSVHTRGGGYLPSGWWGGYLLSGLDGGGGTYLPGGGGVPTLRSGQGGYLPR